MPSSKLTRFLLLPKLSFNEMITNKRSDTFFCQTNSSSAWCPNCGLETSKVHDHRSVKVRDAPNLSRSKILVIKKRRFRCTGCKKVFTESIDGIKKGARLTERFQRNLLYACDRYASIKDVRRHFKIGNKVLYKRNYDQLQLEWNKRKNNPWPKSIGIDEHSFARNKQYGRREFVTLIVDHNNKRAKELVPGRETHQLKASLGYIPGRYNVKNVTMDLSGTYRSFAQDFFPNAQIIADKFHVIRLPNRILDIYRNKTFKDKKLRLRRYLLMNSRNMDHWKRFEFQAELKKYPELNEVYWVKELMHKLYRCKGRKRASRSLTKLTDSLASTKIPELKTLRKTLMSWRAEILNYFENRLTNARTEGFNTVCKQLQKRAYGFRNFNHYRLKVLYACS